MKELEWVNFLKRSVRKRKDVIVGIGDDCAWVRAGKERLLLKSDLFVEGIHFRLVSMPFEVIGMRAVARVLSDMAACGGFPKFIGISIGLPTYVKEKQLKEILRGVLFMSKKYKFSLVGGDTGRADKLFLDVWGVGETQRFISRNSAKIGDYIFITDKLGARKFNQAFTPRVKESQYLVNNFKINSMIDISDGFAIDLYRLLKGSNKGSLLYQEKIPVTKGFTDIYRGEDYELIFTVDNSEKKIRQLRKRFFFVGIITHKRLGCVLLSKKGIAPLTVKGYTHF